jgi:hypothetical protein
VRKRGRRSFTKRRIKTEERLRRRNTKV